MKSVFIATPAYQYITPETKHTIKNLLLNTKTLKIPYEPHELYNCSLIPMARNEIVRTFLKTDCDFLFFIDADVFIKDPQFYNALDRMAASLRQIISGVYVCKNPPFVPAVMTFERLEKGDHYERFDQYPNPKEVYGCVTGFTMIARGVLEELGEHCFNLQYSDSNKYHPDSQMPEDYSFCRVAREVGYKIWIDPTIELFHAGSYGYCLTDHYYMAEAHFKLKPGEVLPQTQAVFK